MTSEQLYSAATRILFRLRRGFSQSMVLGIAAGVIAGCTEGTAGSEIGRLTREIEVGGLTRSYDYYRPANSPSGKMKGIILAFHGALGTPSSFAGATDLHEVAGRQGFVVAYPAGFRRSWNAGLCCGPAYRNEVDDVAFIGAMIDDLHNVLGGQRLPVFATGFSNGAKMVYRIACSLSSEVVAVAPVGATPKEEDTNCSPSRMVSLLHVHGLEDESAPFKGGEGSIFKRMGRLRSVPDTVQFWVDAAGCSGPPKKVKSSGGNVECVSYDHCASKAEVRYCTVSGLGHHWPGSTATGFFSNILGPTSDAYPASKRITEFFRMFAG